ncbi:MAG: hypothetical protein M3Z22_05505 [Verrucomicrobiota bacterium]|nr:hypothetical protein [Verrucomicrobiota bacterium]
MRFRVFLFSCSLLALVGCGTTPSAKAPPVTAAMASRGHQQLDLATLNRGRSAFLSRCGHCHALPDLHEHPAADWPRLVAVMAPRSGLNADERAAVLAYIAAARAE